MRLKPKDKLFFVLVGISLLLNFVVLVELSGVLPRPIFSLFNSAKKVSFQSGDATLATANEKAIVNLIDTLVPGVVTIKMSATRTSYSIERDPYNPFRPYRRVPQEEQISQNIGSGFIVDAGGVVVTNKHVVSEGGAKYFVVTNDGKEYPVQLIKTDSGNDLAAMKIEAKNLKALTLGDSANLKLGQTVYAIGTPLGEFTNTVTNGIISGLGRGITAGSNYEGYVEKLDNVVQTNAAINPGNSGGPLLNSSGQVVGINTAIAQGSENIGFAIPANVIRNFLSGVSF